MAREQFEPVRLADDPVMLDLGRVTVLALDLGDHAGWALSTAGQLAASGTIDLRATRAESAEMRWVRLRRWLGGVAGDPEHSGLLAERGVNLIVIEWVARHAAHYAAHIYGGHLATIQLLARERRIPMCSLSVYDVKRQAGVGGRGSKDAVMRAARRRWPAVELADDNQADAMWLLDAVLHSNALLA